MARIRTIKPEFFTSDTVSQLPLRTRLTFIGMWTHSDDHGRSRDNVRLIKAAVWPLDEVSIKDIEIDLNTLADRGLIFRYTVDGKTYIQVSGWNEHQKVDRPSKSPIPAPGQEIPAQNTRDRLATDSRVLASDSIGKGKERKGKEGSEIASDSRVTPAPNHPSPEPPPRCSKHLEEPSDIACGPCKDARQVHQRWDQDRAKAASLARQTEARTRAETNRAEIDACQLCDHTGYAAGALCNHDPHAADRTRRGKQAALDAIAKAA